MNTHEDVYSIRPAGRHLLTIGRDLIKDKYAAVVELVKNAYDADSRDVIISFIVSDSRDSFSIVIEDHGHGMSRDDVICKWLVPSTTDKLDRKQSATRTMQGRKGIGRWSASILGVDLLLETTTPDGSQTSVYIEWSAFEASEFMDQVPILVETKQTNHAQGTKLTICSTPAEIEYWARGVDEYSNSSGYALLERELSKLVSPFSTAVTTAGLISDEFEIFIDYGTLLETGGDNRVVTIQPIPIVEAFDYSISGKISNTGKGILTYQTQKARNTVTEDIAIDLNRPTECGDLIFDLRVFDRDPESISELINRSNNLKHTDGTEFGKREAKNLLNEYNGIGVYRNGFRIRPLGDPAFDWLLLNKRRVQEPSRSIGSDQVIGYIQIQSEELSGLEEKAARDGLKENEAFENLTAIVVNSVLPELERRRFEFRRNADVGRHKNRIEANIAKLNPIKELGGEIVRVLKRSSIRQEVSEEVSAIIEKQDRAQSIIVENIKEAIAVYQGQATLGKIVNVVLHEGRKAIGYFIDICPLMQGWLQIINPLNEHDAHKKLEGAIATSLVNANMLAGFYRQLDPLASVQRGRKSPASINNAIAIAQQTLHGECERNSISFIFDPQEDVSVICWRQDLQIIFTNLFENSIYWLVNTPSILNKEIRVFVNTENGEFLSVDVTDSGPGVESKYIETAIIFEPGFSTKPKGTGLGLAIAGEAAERCSLSLIAVDCETGGHFRLSRKGEDGNV